MMESVIRLENFYFAYNKSELVLQDIDLEIKKGSFTVVAGPSGAGKTTLCKAMTGIVPFYMGGRYSGDKNEKTLYIVDIQGFYSLLQ